MSTEQKPSPVTAPTGEPTALASGLAGGWDKFKQGKVISFPVMALILILVTAVGVGLWIRAERAKAEAAKWTELDGLSTVAALEEFAKKNPDTIQAKIANLEIARIHLGPDGIDKMLARDSDNRANPDEARMAREARAAGVANVEKAREEFAKLVDQFALKDDPAIHVECLFACAKAEAVLVGIPKDGQPDQLRDPTKIVEATARRGDPARAIEWLDRVTAAAPDTDWGKSAKSLADVLRNQNFREQVQTLQANLFDTSPALPNFRPDKKDGFPDAPPLPGLPGQ
jgi:hypothetical protein